jgi:hypothetical protein
VHRPLQPGIGDGVRTGVDHPRGGDEGAKSQVHLCVLSDMLTFVPLATLMQAQQVGRQRRKDKEIYS